MHIFGGPFFYFHSSCIFTWQILPPVCRQLSQHIADIILLISPLIFLVKTLTIHCPNWKLALPLYFSLANTFSGGSSVTRWWDFVSIFGHLHLGKFAQLHITFAKVGLKVCQILNKLSKYCRKLSKFCQSDKNLPNLVTLVGRC